MNLEQIYKNLPDETKDYYLSLDQSLINQLLTLVKNNYDYKLRKLNNKHIKFQEKYDEQLKSISYINERKDTLDEWVTTNQNLKNTFEFKNKYKELRDLYFELKNAEKEIKDFNIKKILFNEEKEKLNENKLHHLTHLLNENQKIDKKNEQDEKLRQILQTLKEEQERERLEEERLERELLEEIEREKRENLLKIKNEANRRGITQLVHFTMINHLGQILKEGIFSRRKLRKDKLNNPNYSFTDLDDYGNNSEWISTTISFPNYKMFYKKRMNKEGLEHLKEAKGWAVIALDSKVIWELDCRFSHLNAAARSYFTTPSFAKYEKFVLMFGQSNLRSPNLPDEYTSDPQAEVLVSDYIPTKYIKEIFFEDIESANNFTRNFNPNVKVTVDRKYFKYRADYSYQSQLPSF